MPSSHPLLTAPPVRALLFDVDGTLYTQSGLRRTMLLQLARSCLRDPRAGYRVVAAIRAYRQAQEHLREGSTEAGPLSDAQIALACRRSGLPEPFVRNCVAEWMERRPLARLPAFTRPGLPEFLQEAEERGIACAVVSDYPARAKLRALGIDQHFREVVCAQDPEVGALKPSPKGLLWTLRRLGVAPEEALYVGDRPEVDALAAERAGMRCAIVGTTRRAPGQLHVTAPDYARLREMLGWR